MKLAEPIKQSLFGTVFRRPAFRLLLVLLLIGLVLVARENGLTGSLGGRLQTFVTILSVWRSDQVGAQEVGVMPVDGAANVSTRSRIKVTFDQPMAAASSASPLVFDPPVTGSTRWQGSTLVFTPDSPLAPDTTYTVNLASNLQSQLGQDVVGPSGWQFTTRSPQLLYIAPDEAGHDQIFVINPNTGATTQLTHESIGVFDYRLSPDGATIAYAALREDGASDLWAVSPEGNQPRPLLICPDAMCNGAAWAADSRRLVYERRNIFPDAAPGPPRLWWLDPATGDTVQVFGDTRLLGYGATWSPAGEWLSYVSPNNQGVQVYNIDDGRSRVIPSRMGGLASWSPRGDALVVADIRPSDEGFAVHLFKTSPEGGELMDISGEGEWVEDGSPVWSPDGGWLALTRKVAGASMGKQIWLMRPDGSEAHYLTNDTGIHHGAPRWSPDGNMLVYQRSPLTEPGALPSIWLLNVDTGNTREVVAAGNRPAWLP